MGQAESKFSTPLSLVLDHFKEFKRRSEGYGERVHKARLTTFVTQEWPLGTQGVWPPSGSFNMETAQAARQYVFGSPAHPDQIVYIQIWIDIICDAPSWIKPSQDRVFAALKPKVKPKKLPSDPTTPPVLPSEEDPLDPLEALSLPPPHPASDPQPDSSAPSLPCPGHTCRHPQPEASSEQSSEAAPLCPLREVPRLGGSSMFVYTPFSFSDLYYWKSLIPPFSKDPETLINLLESLFYTHRPTWGDCQQILLIFFTAEERLHIRTLGQNAVRELDGSASTDQQRIERLFPSSQPNWDPNTDEVPADTPTCWPQSTRCLDKNTWTRLQRRHSKHSSSQELLSWCGITIETPSNPVGKDPLPWCSVPPTAVKVALSALNGIWVSLPKSSRR
ncbi:uncharacterized protein LOC106025343 isoform X2 [Cavia porcellus]|uniref:uncharacterized protein LOC106025343 isoform X2 n=1 Tax=Cavia porcellus TaxID=10141 RepID=UPI002FE12133